ncbi:hypothetical protein ACFQY0_20820 [Haloferula chungangensis]|uniref:Uncharacterized protein n=1 Tax=Haloferula chungangensis TaxID=1048331 RepID=A0ABW2LDF9_9BACT
MRKLTAAGNTEVPAYLALRQLGYEVTRESIGEGAIVEDAEIWIARQDDEEISGASPLEILGLHLMREVRGADWLASDAEIETYVRHYYPEWPPDLRP